jgi:hypothetical protein
MAAATRRLPKGLAFDIADLVLAGSWASFNDARMTIRLDHGTEDEEYEEVIDFYAGCASTSRLIMWRNADAVFVQPVPGRKQLFGSLGEALDSVFPNQPPVLSDIVAAAWPVD